MSSTFFATPIAKKLIRHDCLYICLVLLASFLFLSSLATYYSFQHFQNASISKTKMLAESLHENLISANQKQIDNSILATSSDDSIDHILIYDKEGIALIAWNQTEHFAKAQNYPSIPASTQTKSQFNFSHLEVLTPIRHNNEQIASLQLQFSSHNFVKELSIFFITGFLFTAGCAAVAVLLLSRKSLNILAPVFSLAKTIEQVASTGDYSIRAKDTHKNQDDPIHADFNAIMAHIESWESDVQSEARERREAERRLSILENHDSLTKLPNRHFFHRLLTNCVEDAVQNNQLSGLAFVDLDEFKSINDEYGYDAGDLILATLANRLCAALRNTDTLCRVDGDEFAAILPEIGSIEMAQTVAERLLHAVQEPIVIRGKKLLLTASVGIACCPLHAKEQRLFLHNTDLALKAARAAGHNTWRIFTPDMLIAAAKPVAVQLDLPVNV